MLDITGMADPEILLLIIEELQLEMFINVPHYVFSGTIEIRHRGKGLYLGIEFRM